MNTEMAVQRLMQYRPYLILLLLSSYARAQPLLTLDEALAAARRSHPAVRAAELATEQARRAERGAVLLPQPQVLAESPTGDFYTIGIEQSFEWPGVYRAERALARQQTELTRLEQGVVSNELLLAVRQTYIEWQYAAARVDWHSVQDTVYGGIRDAAERQFRAGEIDYVQKSYAETQYVSQQMGLLQARADADAAWRQLQLLTGLDGPRLPQPLPAGPLLPEGSVNNPRLVVARAAVTRETLNLRAEQLRTRPGFTVGYLNQAERSTPLYNRFRAGITLPVWQGAYRSRIESARTGVAVAEQQLAAAQLELDVQRVEAQARLDKWQSALALYRQAAQPRAAELRDSARRLFEAGQVSFTDYLRIVADANQFELGFLEALYEFNRASATLVYLNGNQ